MKGLKTILGIALATTGFAGSVAFGVAGHSNSKKVEVAEAANQTITDSTIEIRFTRPSDWGDNAIKIYTWNDGGSGTEWPGYLMTWLWNNSYGEGVFSWSPSASEPLYVNIIFNNNNNGKQTDTSTAPSESKWYYSGGWHDVETTDIYLYDYDNRFSGNVNVHAWRGDDNNPTFVADTWPGPTATRLTSVVTNGLVYKFTMNNRYNRVVFSNNGSYQTGNLGSTGNYCYVLANDDTQLDGKNTWWDNINYVFAHNFAQNTMLMRSIPTSDRSSTAQCASRYSAAKAAIKAFNDSGYWEYVGPQLTSNFADAVTRLQAWATANGESFASATGTFSSKVFNPIASENNNKVSIVLMVVIAISTASFAALFLIKKRKHQ